MNRKGRADTKVFFYQGHICYLIPVPLRAPVLARSTQEEGLLMASYLLSCLCSFQGHYAQPIDMVNQHIAVGNHIPCGLASGETWQKVCPCALQLQAAGSSNLHWQSGASKLKFSSGSSTVCQHRATSPVTLWARVCCRHCCAALELLKDSCCDSSLAHSSAKRSLPRGGLACRESSCSACRCQGSGVTY